MRGGPLSTYCTSQLRLQFLAPRIFKKSSTRLPFNSSTSSSTSSSSSFGESSTKLSSTTSESSDSSEETSLTTNLKNVKDRTEYLIELSRLTEERINLLIYHYEHYIKLLSYPYSRSSRPVAATTAQDFDDSDDEEPIATSTTSQLEAVVEVSDKEPPLFPSIGKSNRVVSHPWRLSDSNLAATTSKTSPRSIFSRRKGSQPFRTTVPFWLDKTEKKASSVENVKEKSRIISKVAFLDDLMISMLDGGEKKEEPATKDLFDRVNLDWEFEDLPDLDEDINKLFQQEDIFETAPPPSRTTRNRMEEMVKMKEKVRILKQQMLKMKCMRIKRVESLRQAKKLPIPPIIISDTTEKLVPVPAEEDPLLTTKKDEPYLTLYSDIMNYLEEKQSVVVTTTRLPPIARANAGCEVIISPPRMSVTSFQDRLSSGAGSSGLLTKKLALVGLQDGGVSSATTAATEQDNKPKNLVTRCAFCKKRTGLANSYSCRCGKNFCAQHRYAEVHNCIHDYKSEGRKALREANPVVNASKLPKL